MKLPFVYGFALLHFVVAICCLLVAISISVLQGKLDVRCGFYRQVVVNPGAKYTSSVLHSTFYSTCQYVKGLPAVVFVMSLLLMIYYLYLAVHALRNQEPRFQIWEKMYWWLTIVIGLSLFIASCIISTGFDKSCKQLKDSSERNFHLSCRQIFDNTKFDNKVRDGGIYTFFSLAEISCWVSFLGTLAAFGLSSFLIFSKRCQRKTTQDGTTSSQVT